MDDEDGGYPIELFIKLDYADKLTCPICFNICKNFVCCTEKEHFFCRSCILQTLRYKQLCPCCRTFLTPMLLKKHSWATEAFEKATVKCLTAVSKSSENGHCDWTGKFKDLRAHLDQCPYDLVRCPYEGCTWRVHRSQLDFHCTSCRYCDGMDEGDSLAATLVKFSCKILFLIVFIVFLYLPICVNND